MRSIQRRLLITIVIGSVVLPIEFGVVAYAILYDAFRDDPNVRLWQVPLPLAAAGLLAAVVMILLAVHFVRAGLDPLNRFSEDLRNIDAESLHQRIDTEALPNELQSIGHTINALLGRLESAFDRERRTTGNIAHELRTPIAELRTLTEVAKRSPDNAQLAQLTVTEAHAVAEQMQHLVTALLQLARSGERQATEPVKLIEVVDAAVAPLRDRGIDITCAVDESLHADADRRALDMIVSNLASNAVTYCAAGGEVRFTAGEADGHVTLAIENTNDTLTEQDVEHLCEPFWRKDAARTGGTHVGLGLTLVADLCKAYGYNLDMELVGDQFRVSVWMRAPSD